MLGGESNLVRLHPAPTESPDAATPKVGIAVVGARCCPTHLAICRHQI